MEHKGRKLYLKEFIIIYMHNIHAGGITRGEYTNMSLGRIIQTLFYKQTVCGRCTKLKKAYLTSVSNMTGIRNNVFTVQRIEANTG